MGFGPEDGFVAMMIRRLPIPFMLAILVLGACGSPPDGPAPATPGPTQVAVRADGGPRIVFLGDSLTAGYGLSEEQAYPAQVAALLRAKGIEVGVVNAGVSGDTTAGGLSRVSWVLSQDPAVLVSQGRIRTARDGRDVCLPASFAVSEDRVVFFL